MLQKEMATRPPKRKVVRDSLAHAVEDHAYQDHGSSEDAIPVPYQRRGGEEVVAGGKRSLLKRSAIIVQAQQGSWNRHHHPCDG
jgi:hypothetical protein